MSDNKQMRAQIINSLKTTTPVIVRQPSNNQIRITKNNRQSDYAKIRMPLLKDYISFESTMLLSTQLCFGELPTEFTQVESTPRIIEEPPIILIQQQEQQEEPTQIIIEQPIQIQQPQQMVMIDTLSLLQQDIDNQISLMQMQCKTKIIGEVGVLSIPIKKSSNNKITHKMFMMSQLNKFKKDQPNTVKQEKLIENEPLCIQNKPVFQPSQPTKKLKLFPLQSDKNSQLNGMINILPSSIIDIETQNLPAQKSCKPNIRLPLKQEVSTLNQQSLMFGLNSICEIQECFVNSFANRQLKFYTINQDLPSITPKSFNFKTTELINNMIDQGQIQKVERLKFNQIKSDKIPIIQAFIIISRKQMREDEQITQQIVQSKQNPFSIKQQDVLATDKENKTTKLSIQNQQIQEKRQFLNDSIGKKNNITFLCKEMNFDVPNQINTIIQMPLPFINIEKEIKDVIILSKGQPQYPTLLEMNRIKLEKIKQIIVGGKSPKEFLKLKDFVMQNSSPTKNKKVKDRDHSPKINYISANGSLILDEKNENVKIDKKRSCSIDKQSLHMQMSKNQSSELNRFKKIKYLGRGNMSDVYSVIDQITGIAFALKIIQKSLINSKGIQKLITNEIKIQMHLKHPNILKCYGVINDNKQIALILELSDSTLYSYIRNQKIERNQMIDILQQVLIAVNHLHNNGIMHRDIKPENILMCQNVIKLADLGISIKAEECQQYCGTLGYMAPEVKQNQLYTQKIDCYSIGVLIYEMLFKKINTQTLYPLKNLKQDLLIDLMNQLIQPDPNQRYSCQQALEHQIFIKKDKIEKNDIDYQISKLLY